MQKDLKSADYCGTIKELYTICFETTHEHALLENTAIAAYTCLFSTIHGYCAIDADLGEENFRHYIEMPKEKVESRGLDADIQRPINADWRPAAHATSIARATSEGRFNIMANNFARKIARHQE